jgi:hypothetical protein
LSTIWITLAPDPDNGVQPDEVLAELNALPDRQQQVNPTAQQVDYYLTTDADPQHEAEDQSGDPQRQDKWIGVLVELLGQITIGASPRQVAGVNLAQKAERDELMLHLPDQFGQIDQDGNAHANQEVARAQRPSNRRDQYCNH